MSRIPGKFVWFEHYSDDVAKARAFYEPLLGWNTEVMPMPGGDGYPVIHNGDAGIGGYVKAPPGVATQWLSYVSVDDVDRSHAQAVGAGARSLMGPMDYGQVGRAAMLVDPTGAAFALWRGVQGDPPDSDRTPTGGWLWNELTTPEPEKALAFYAALLGYTHEAMPMPQGTYWLLKQGEQSRGGIVKTMQAGTPAMWMQYVKVDDCDATAQKAGALGARIVVPPSDIPGIGRFAMAFDPQGAAIAVMKPAQP